MQARSLQIVGDVNSSLTESVRPRMLGYGLVGDASATVGIHAGGVVADAVAEGVNEHS